MTDNYNFHLLLTPRHVLDELRFPADDTLCTGDRWSQSGCNYNGEGPAMAIHTIKGKAVCGYHSPTDNKYVPCTRCSNKPAPRPDSVEEDPLCDDCIREMIAQDAEVREFNNDEGGCPGWGDSCENTLEGDNDLCPDCTMGRMNAQSPRIPQ